MRAIILFICMSLFLLKGDAYAHAHSDAGQQFQILNLHQGQKPAGVIIGVCHETPPTTMIGVAVTAEDIIADDLEEDDEHLHDLPVLQFSMLTGRPSVRPHPSYLSIVKHQSNRFSAPTHLVGPAPDLCVLLRVFRI